MPTALSAHLMWLLWSLVFQTPPPAPTAFVLGQVVDAATKTPIVSATVTMTPPVDPSAPAARDAAATRRVLTDSQGHFLFRDLTKGTYIFSATASGYLDGGYGQRRPVGATQPFTLADGQHVGDLSIELWKEATIAGVVTDDLNAPVIGVSLTLAKRETVGGRVQLDAPQFTSSYLARTDDRGAYRFAGLEPGDYLVSVAAKMTAMPIALVNADAAALASLRASGSTALGEGMTAMSPAVRVGDFIVQTSAEGNSGSANSLASRLPMSVGAGGAILAYPTTFYPGATTVSEAVVVTLKSGDDRAGVDVHLHPVAMMRVSGTVEGPNGPLANMAVHLLPDYAVGQNLERTHETAVTATGSSGTFTFPAVAPGQYVLRAWRIPPASAAPNAPPASPTLWGETPIAVTDAALTNVALTLRTGATISGHVEFDGTTTPPRATTATPMLSVGFQSPWPLTVSGAISNRVNDAGEFSTELPSGKYFANLPNRFSVRGWYFESATLDGKDLLITPIVLDAQNVSGVVIKLSDRRTELTGTVNGASGQPDANAAVLIFPADYKTWLQNGMFPLAARLAIVSPLGTYSMNDLKPGEYLAAAASDEALTHWQASTIEALAPLATHVTLTLGGVTRQDLTTRVIR